MCLQTTQADSDSENLGKADDMRKFQYWNKQIQR